MKFFLSVAVLFATGLRGWAVVPDPPVDYSKASADGPHIFYKRGQIITKRILGDADELKVDEQVYQQRSDITVTCEVGDDRFSFPLQPELKVSQHEYAQPARMLVTSDIEGNFHGFKMLLQQAGVINNRFEWTYGDGHLVLLGDFFDRGLNVTECLWLIYKLETEAEAAGGKVHFIMGNHEVMNLAGEDHYVRKKYHENAKLIDEPYHRWFDKNTELGRWLRTKNAVEKIGGYLYCHGGISPEMAEYRLSLTEINRLARRFYGIKSDRIGDSYAAAVFDTEIGIFWSRKASKNQLRTPQMAAILEQYDARALVVAHTLMPDITLLYGGLLICIDLYHEENTRQGFMKALYVDNGTPYVYSTAERLPLVLAAPHSSCTGSDR